MVDQFDHRAKGYRAGRGRAADWEDLPFGSPAKSIQPQWFIPRDRIPEKCRKRITAFRIGFCDVASPTNERTLVAALLPLGVICGDKVPTIVLLTTSQVWQFALWIAVANSYAMDFIARRKVSLSMSYTVLDSLPFPRLRSDDRARVAWSRGVFVCHAPALKWSLSGTSSRKADGFPRLILSPRFRARCGKRSGCSSVQRLTPLLPATSSQLTRTELEYISHNVPDPTALPGRTYRRVSVSPSNSRGI